MTTGTILKYILIAALILAGYYVVSSTAFKRREGFSIGSGSGSSSGSSSGETPPVTAKKSADVLTDKTKSMVGTLQITDNRITYETLLEMTDV